MIRFISMSIEWIKKNTKSAFLILFAIFLVFKTHQPFKSIHHLLATRTPLSVPVLTGPVMDLAGMLSNSEVKELSEISRSRYNRNKGQIQILIVPTLENQAIEVYANKVFHEWQLGRKGIDDGVLIVIASEDHKLRIEVGRGLEGNIPDIRAKQIISDIITPAFKAKMYFEGLKRGMTAVGSLIDKEPLMHFAPLQCGFKINGSCDPVLLNFCLDILPHLFFFLLILYLSYTSRRSDWADANGGDASGSNSSSSSGGASDWSGGGGDSGGGGASGSW